MSTLFPNALAAFYYLGEGVKQDYAKAVELFIKTAKHGPADAQEALEKVKEKIGC